MTFGMTVVKLKVTLTMLLMMMAMMMIVPSLGGGPRSCIEYWVASGGLGS